jgi:hypothetical protein
VKDVDQRTEMYKNPWSLLWTRLVQIKVQGGRSQPTHNVVLKLTLVSSIVLVLQTVVLNSLFFHNKFHRSILADKPSDVEHVMYTYTHILVP